jgi:hypothetical protein
MKKAEFFAVGGRSAADLYGQKSLWFNRHPHVFYEQ